MLKLRSEGKRITVTDGITYGYPLSGEDHVEIDVSRFENPLAVSLIPWDFSVPVTGVTTEGLYYPLNDQELSAGSSFSFSNHPDGKNGKVSITIRSGRLFVTLTFAN